MAREILFKAKRADKGEWVEGLLTVMWGQYHMINLNDENTAYPIDPETICQYTGLTDKSDKKIWENDIVEAWSAGTKASGKIWQRIDGTWTMYPAWQNGDMWYLLPNEVGGTTVKVIGNIFDNPELLEGENE